MIICKVPDRKRVRVGTSTPFFYTRCHIQMSYTWNIYIYEGHRFYSESFGELVHRQAALLGSIKSV